MTSAEYLKLLDWTAREHAGRRGKTPNYVAPLFERLEISESTWLKLAQNFGRLFSVVAGHPHTVDSPEPHVGQHRYRATRAARDLLEPV